jgi:hypothetical protein
LFRQRFDLSTHIPEVSIGRERIPKPSFVAWSDVAAVIAVKAEPPDVIRLARLRDVADVPAAPLGICQPAMHVYVRSG